MEYNNTLYYYRHNLQGDIVEIIDSNGNVMVNYTYDAWGAPTGIEGTLKTTLGELNPFRYRSYVWDVESGLYYLRSRYYAPSINRFISRDILIDNSTGMLSSNMYIYCNNSPIKHRDKNGTSPGLELSRSQIADKKRHQWALLSYLRMTESIYKYLNPFKACGEGPNKQLPLKSIHQKNYYIFDEDTAKALTNKTHVRVMTAEARMNTIMSETGNLIGVANSIASKIWEYGTSFVHLDVPENVYVNMGVYTTQLLVFEDSTVMGTNTYVAKRTISVFEDSPLNTDWTITPMYDTEMTEQLIADMCIMQ